jgi:GDP-4-dehydro-6-deoxy-D-mannose reductase
MRSQESVADLVRTVRADRVFHLAALASAGKSMKDPVPPFEVNAVGTLLLLEELRKARLDTGDDPRILISGSAEVYGSASTRFQPLTEDCPIEPLNPYAVSKAAQEMLGMQYHRADGLSVVVTRSFNHLGPGQHSVFVAPQLAQSVKDIRNQGGVGSIKVGNTAIRRDFTDVRDVVRAYVALTENGQPGGVYNVCSGRSYSIGQLLEVLVDLEAVEVEVETDPTRARRVDVPEMVGSYTRLADSTGWEPEIDVRQSLADLLASLDTE